MSKNKKEEIKNKQTDEEKIETPDLGEITEFFGSNKKQKNKKDDNYYIEIDEDLVIDDIHGDEEDELSEIRKKNEPKKIDISKILINKNKNELQKNKDIRHVLYSNKTAFQIVLTQSAYQAAILPLVNKDILKMVNSNLDRYTSDRELFKLIYDKIYIFGFENNERYTFEEWLANTSTEDITTFYYGLYCASYPEQTFYDITCTNIDCGKTHTYKVKHENLITYSGDISERIKEIKLNVRSKEDVQKYSMVKTHDAYLLEDSGMIIELKIPSLSEYLEIIRTISPAELTEVENMLTYLLYTSRILVPSTSDDGMTEIKSTRDIMNIIKNLSLNDSRIVKTVIAEIINKNRLYYSIKNIKCPSCGHVMSEIPIDISDILFTQISEETR